MRRTFLAAMVVAALALSPAVPAAAAEPDPPTTYELGAPTSVEARYAYGAARGDSIPIGVDTARIVIQTSATEETDSLRGAVACTIYGAHSDSVEEAGESVPLGGTATRRWTAEEWADPEARFIDLPAGTIAVWPDREDDDYDRFDLYCDGFELGAARQVTQLLWRLTPYEAVAPVITLTEDPALRFGDEVSSRYESGEPARTLTTGQEVRVVGPAGSWPAPGASGGLEAKLVTNTSETTLPAQISDDRSTVAFAIPELAAPPGPTAGAFLAVASHSSVVSEGTTITRRVSWQAPVTVNLAGLGPSETTVSVARYTVKWWRPTATVTVERATTPAGTPWGSVRLLVDGEPFGPDVALDARGTAKIRLPSLDKGRYVVSALYLGDAATGPSLSSEAPVRVLF